MALGPDPPSVTGRDSELLDLGARGTSVNDYCGDEEVWKGCDYI